MPSTKMRTPTKTPRLQISATQLIASALAAVTATFAASYLGVSGTVIGAAIASVVTVTGNAVYGHSLHRTSERVRTAVPTTARWLPPARPDTDDDAEPAATPHVVSPLMRRLAIACVAVFAAVLAVVTSVELVAGRPLSDLLRGKSGQGTTIFGTSNETRDTPTPTVTQTVIPTVVVTTPTVTHTAPAVTKSPTPTVAPSTPPPSATTPPTTPPTSPATPTA